MDKPAPRDVARHGQVFTPPAIVERMLALRRNFGTVLEPAAGDGAFAARLPGCTAVELDGRHCPPGALNLDFFAYPERHRFDTIIGNPPYVRYQDIQPSTKALLPRDLFDGRSNLYLFFIEKCLRHLNPGGELIFITPRDFLKATSSVRLNRWLYQQGTITDAIDLGDLRLFEDALPNCLIWRFVKGDLSRRTRYSTWGGVAEERHFLECAGHLLFTRGHYPLRLSQLCYVKVGAVSGDDAVFASDVHGNRDFVCSQTARTGRLRRMIYNERLPYLERFKERLLARRIKRFDESNWWTWGRNLHESQRPRVYVNAKTRTARPFFLHDCPNFDGAVLAVFPRDPRQDVHALCAALNGVDWADIGFVCDGRYLFTQRSLENAPLPAAFACFLQKEEAAVG